MITVINLLLRSRFIPQHWRRRSAKKHTLMGALAIAEEDWPAAERAMIKGADNGELPALNLLAPLHVLLNIKIKLPNEINILPAQKRSL